MSKFHGNGRPNILITGGNFLNQGAFLMLVAAATEIRERFDAQPVVEVQYGSERQKSWYGLETLIGIQKLHIRPYLDGGPRWQRVKDRMPFVLGSDIDAVFDVSGFAFGDQWSDANLSRKAAYFAYWKAKDVPVYLLPQAFGPFTKTSGPATLAINDSRNYVNSLRTHSAITQSPDFTTVLHGQKPTQHVVDTYSGAVPLVPNWNIVSRASKEDASAYISNLAMAATELKAQGLRPYGLSHEGKKDTELLRVVAEKVTDFPIHVPRDGLEAKWIIGTAPIAVAGRFHALVSALSQGVPSVIHGWSHKYRWLAEDFGVPGLVRDPYEAPEDIRNAIASLVSEQKALRPTIESFAAIRKSEVIGMWNHIYDDFSAFQSGTDVHTSVGVN
jgi:hypothetical protein